MPTNLTAIEHALARLTDIELHALIVASNEPQIATGLLAWIEGDPSEDTVSTEATYALRESFASGDMAPAVLKFFDALVALLTGGGQRQRH